MKSRWHGFKSVLATMMERYLAAKRALGCRFVSEEKELRLFDRFLVRRRLTRIRAVTPAIVEMFLASRSRNRPRSFNHMLGVLRRLFGWMVAQGKLRRSPLRQRPRRETSHRVPFIFDPAEARRLLDVASALPSIPSVPLRGPTYHLIFALLYALGIRVGEVSRLLRRDVDLTRQLLIVRDTKFGKSRLVPFGPRVGALLARYLELRYAATDCSPDSALFCFRQGRTIHPCTISQTFHALVPRLRLPVRAGVGLPRVHDLRHSFAVRALLRWYREGADPQAHLLHLSTFLGHVSPSSTAVYLTITHELLDEAGERFERFASIAVEGAP